MKTLLLIPVVAFCTLVAVGPSSADEADGRPYEVRALSISRPSTVTLSEMEKANNALARVFGRIEPHVAQPVSIIQWSDGVLVK